MAWVLWSRHLKTCPTDPGWPDRDRFVLSAGHGSMLLYGLLHLAGYPVSLDDIRNFRQWESRTPGHPETFATPGVEATTGPLGQGAGNSVGMAIAERALRARFLGLVDHRVFALVSDGDLMEGVCCEAASLAGQLGLGRLVWLYDQNDVTLDGPASLSFAVEDVAARHRALGWHVQTVADGNHDLDGIDAAIAGAVAETERPSLIVVKTTIGYGAPTKAGKSAAHGAPLGAEEAATAKAALGLDPETFFAVPAGVRERCAERAGEGEAARSAWYGRLERARTEAPEQAAELERRLGNGLPEGWDEGLPAFGPGDRLATRDASGKAMNALAARIPEFFGGDADLSCSTKTALVGFGSQSQADASGRNLHYGVREHAMAAAANGIAYHGGFRTFASTFFCFADYMRPSVRLAALSALPVVYVWTHDSVGVGEDGPTHQPVEHLMSLRVMPNLHVVRPADANETVEAWRHALRPHRRPHGAGPDPAEGAGPDHPRTGRRPPARRLCAPGTGVSPAGGADRHRFRGFSRGRSRGAARFRGSWGSGRLPPVLGTLWGPGGRLSGQRIARRSPAGRGGSRCDAGLGALRGEWTRCRRGSLRRLRPRRRSRPPPRVDGRGGLYRGPLRGRTVEGTPASSPGGDLQTGTAARQGRETAYSQRRRSAGTAWNADLRSA